MANKAPFRNVFIKPASGLLDTRVTPDEVPIGGYRAVQNWEVLQKTKMCRASGHTKLMDGLFNNNADLHDQLEGQIRQPLVFLFSYRTAIGLDKLFAATQNRLYAFNNSTGNWRIIWDNIGDDSPSCPERSWWAAGFGDVVVFTNGQPGGTKWHVIDQPFEADGQAVAAIPDLALLKITQVGFVAHWNGLTFYGNVVSDGTRKSYRLLWTDYQNPVSLKPKASVSVAGYKDLDFGEVILNAKPLGNSLLIYTNLGIWEAVTDSVAGVSISARYTADRPGDRCLAYPRTLISTGAEHYFFAGDGIYLFSFYVPKPERVDWIHRGSSLIFDDINSQRCQGHCAGYEVSKKQLKFSWAKAGESCPSQTLVINTEFPFVGLEDQGASAFANFGASTQYSVRQFMLDQCICTAAEMEAAGLGFVKEGGYCNPALEVAPVCNTRPICFWTNTGMDLDGVSVEDFSAGMDPNSLCARLAGLTVDDLCNAEALADQCKNEDEFIFAATLDNALKQTDANAYYRETLSDASGCGSYAKLGYVSLLRSGPLDMGVENDKYVSRFSVEAYAAEQTLPSLIGLKVGSAQQAVDPNSFSRQSKCVILYEEEEPIPLQCQSDVTAEEAEEQGVRPDNDFTWALAMVGRNFYYEISVTNPEAGNTGGACCLSRFSYRVRVEPAGA